VAQVAGEVGARADHFLDYLSREWEAVPDYVAEFGTWDDVQQLAFVHEWDIRESGLRTLRDFAEQGLLAPAQRDRYDQLLELVARHRPAIERLLED
jgi:hypothetical protein